MTTVALTAASRSDFGKGAARRTRRAGQTPGVIYGGDIDLLHVSFDTHELDLALRKPRVVLSVTLDGQTITTKPRDIQRDPVKRTLEHIDLVVITAREAKLRSEYADAIKKVHDAAVEAGVDPSVAVQMLEVAVHDGEDPMVAAEHAVADAEEQARVYAEAARAAAAAAEAAEAAAAGEGGEESAAAAPAEADAAASE